MTWRSVFGSMLVFLMSRITPFGAASLALRAIKPETQV
jgi:hypothetical protein